MKILVRLPNWLGDMVMSIGFLKALEQVYPGCLISVIAKKGIHSLVEFFPVTCEQFIFSRGDYPGLRGAWQFGKMILQKGPYDLFFCLPDSFSSALIGYASGARQRIGYGKELRSVLLSAPYKKRRLIHRVDEYLDLLSKFSHQQIKQQEVSLLRPSVEKKDSIVLNLNSEASSRRIPVEKATSLITNVMHVFSNEIVLIGGKGDRAFTEEVLGNIPASPQIINLTGLTTLPELVVQMASSRLLLSTDSGPAHVANALGVPTVVLFGAGNERNTSPYNKNNLSVIRYGKLPCEPCVKNTCLLYGSPKCLELLDNKVITDAMRALLGE